MSDPFIATLAFIAVISIPALAVALWATWIDLRDTQAALEDSEAKLGVAWIELSDRQWALEDSEAELAHARAVIHRLRTGIPTAPEYPYDFDENIDNDHWQHF